MTEGGSKSGWTELRAKTVDEADCYRGSDHVCFVTHSKDRHLLRDGEDTKQF